MSLLGNNLHEESITENKVIQNFNSVHITLICTCVTMLHLCYIENALIFSLSEAYNLCLNVISISNNMILIGRRASAS